MDAAAASVLYALLTLLVTWPLAGDLAHSVAGDFGDPLFNSWVLAWDATHMFSRGWWNANIFTPHPLTLAYSDHLAAQALQILPFYWLVGNPLLVYNLAVLSTFVLSGLGMFLLTRDLTANRLAAFVGGLAFAFTPYRIGALPHLTVLSSAWMPFTILGFSRYFQSGGLLPLAGAALAWIAQNLSSGYYLLFFSPVVVIYLVWEIVTRRLWRNPRTMAGIASACLLVAFVTVPFALPYLELRELGFEARSLQETQQFSADVYGYFTADINLWLWGSIVRAWPRAEGSLFLGLTATTLGVVAASRQVRPIVVLPLIVVIPLVLGRTIRLPGLRIGDLARALLVVLVLTLLLLVFSRRARARLAEWLKTPQGCWSMITGFAVVMSFGPAIHARGRIVLENSIYTVFYRLVPGYDGLRVPARFAMIAAFGLAALSALALSRIRRPSFTLIAGALVVVESLGLPVPINQKATHYVRTGLAPLPPLERNAPPVYGAIASLAPTAVLLELPLGEPAFDLRYMFWSTTHWRRIVNGYSGGFPSEYDLLDQALQDILIRPDRAWSVLHQTVRPTHILVHETYYEGDRGRRVSEWVHQHGAREIATFGGDRLFQFP